MSFSDKVSEYIGYWVKIKCKNCFCTGEINTIDSNTIILTNSSINDVITHTKYLGIDKTLIHSMDIIDGPINKANENYSRSSESSTSLNVYTSSAQPPVIYRGGSSSAVHRNLSKFNNSSQERVQNGRNYNSPEKNFRPRITSSGSIPKDHYLCNGNKKDGHRSRNFSDTNFRTRKLSSGNMNKEPSWVNYQFNDDSVGFDFDSNLALFDKNSFSSNLKSKRKVTESMSYDSSDSGGINITFPSTKKTDKQRSRSIGFQPYDFLSHDDNVQKTDEICEFNEHRDVYTELRIMGIIPTPTKEEKQDCSNRKTNSISDIFFNDYSFLQQPDIIQEVTKSQLCNSDLHLPDNSNILSVSKSTQDFQIFSDFWKLDNDLKFPVFTLYQRNKLFECANKFGYDIRTIAEGVGKNISEFVVHQVGGVTRLNRINLRQIPKIAVILGLCQTSVFAASVANSLLVLGCHVIVYVDDSCHQSNEDVELEINSINSSLLKFGRNCDLSFLTFNFKDLKNKTFDYIITGVESDSNFQGPQEDLIQWGFKQKAPILSIDPPTTSFIPWKVAAFVGIPTCSYKHLFLRTSYIGGNGLFKPRTDGVCGLEIDKMFKKPDGLVVLCDINLPLAVYSLLNLNFNSPFNSKKWIRLYRENEELMSVE